MTQAPSVQQPGPAAWFRKPAAVTLGAVIAVGLFIVLFPWFPGADRLEADVSAPLTLASPRDVSFDSEVLTEQQRTAAAAAVPDVLVHDPGIADRQLIELERQLKEINDARTDPSLSASARESEIRRVAGTALSPRATAVFARATSSEWQALTDEATNALQNVLAGSITDNQVPDAQQRAVGVLSPFLSGDQLIALTELLEPLVVATVVVDEEKTAAARDGARAAQPPVHVTRSRGEVLVEQGQILTAADIELLDEAGIDTVGVNPRDVMATGLLSILIGAATGGYLLVAQPQALAGIRRQTLFGLLLLLPAAGAKFALPLFLPDVDRHFLAYALPLAASPMAAAVLLDVGTAILLAALLATVSSFVTVYVPLADSAGAGQLETTRTWLAVSAGSLAGLYVAARATRLHRYLVAGLVSAAAAAAALVLVWMLDAQHEGIDLFWIAAATVAGGVLSALIAVGAFVLLSRPFGIITRVELMELAQLSHPLLRRLQDEAAGTFQHSIMVGNMAERAADRIGADSLLVRVGAYYHDIGKLVSPSFFVENDSGENGSPHDKLDPLQSTRVIHQHVTSGIDIARREGLPAAVIQFIPQHHGTRLAQFFYRRAAEADSDVDPQLFRYPGPKPQSREAALVMLADSCEATVRASSDRSKDRLREIIDAVIQERLAEGQFDECDISMRDLRIVAETFLSTMGAVYHPRVEYPEPTERELAERERAALPGDGVGRPAEPDASTTVRRPLAPTPSEEGTAGPELSEDDS